MIADQSFQGEVKVASSIVDFLSSGLYESPAACLKELVNNSYDADATKVDVFIKPDANSIIVADNGTGFTKNQFVAHFDRVSRSTKREQGDTTARDRPKIGLIGIGFIAANELCEEMLIRSTTLGSSELLEVTIDFRRMRESQTERRGDDDAVTKADYRGVVSETDAESHYTEIYLSDVREKARDILVGASRARGIESDGISLYGLGPATIVNRLQSPRLVTWQEFDFYSQTMLGVALNVPVLYAKGWIPKEYERDVQTFEKRLKSLEFSVSYDGTDLRKPTVLQPGDGRHIFRKFELIGSEVRAEGYLFARHGTIRPENLNGILIRVRNAAVGEYRADFLEFPKTINTLFQRWVTGEIWADNRLEAAMNIDRRTLRSAHPAYADLQTMFHGELEDFLKLVRRELHGTSRHERAAADAKEQVEGIKRAFQRSRPKGADLSEGVLHDAVGSETAESWSQGIEDKELIRRLVRKYTVSEVYDIVLDVAVDVLSPEDLERFLNAFTRRLHR